MRNNEKNTYPVIPLLNTLVTPNTIIPLVVGREASKNAVEEAFAADRKIICILQRPPRNTEKLPKSADIYRIGSICNIVQLLTLPDGNIRVLVEGLDRVGVERFIHYKDYLGAKVFNFPKKMEMDKLEEEATLRSFKKVFSDYVALNQEIPEETLLPVRNTSSLKEFFYYVISNVILDIDEKQKFYKMDSMDKSIQKMIKILNKEIQVLKLKQNIDSKVKKKLSKTQKEYYLSEQLKAIHNELGITKEDKSDVFEFKKKLKELNLSRQAKKKAEEEIKKLARLNTVSPEYSVVHSYLNWIFDIPWDEPQLKEFELKQAEAILDKDHYGLKKVKERILEYLAVVKLANKVRGQILCFVGPPGVGKTSLGKSIASAMDRKFIRLSLGGVRDEAEIRGHRRTYVGAMPGVIIKSMKNAGTRNPLIMMDEVDKLSSDFRGDPASALLEVLDPEQNNTFRDHYLDFEYDLSQVIFITTANTLSNIPRPLLDRMEIIEIPGYTAYEKVNIATKHLVPKVMKTHDIKGKINIDYERKAIEEIIKSYTREAGVRELERKITKILRKAIKKFIMHQAKEHITIRKADLEEYLGVPKHLYSEVNRTDSIGIATGLAWTQYGGRTLEIEVLKVHGSGKLKLTGKLGDVMQESAKAAWSYVRHHYQDYGIKKDFYKHCDIHIHVPEGAIPKDGPSAGITLITALTSILSGRKVKHNLAMTGEITLTGKILPIGGLAEKLIAAKRVKISNVIIPKKNEPNLTEVAKEIKKGLNIMLMETVGEVLDYALIKE